MAPTPAASGPARPAAPTRVALVGCGAIAEAHLAALRTLPHVEVVALVDPAPGRAQALARRHGVAAALERVADLPGLGVGVAHVLVPPALHGSVARELLDLGLSVLLEKPAALTSREARELAERAAGAGLTLGVNHNHRFHPAFRRLLARVRAGEIGRVEHVQATWSVPLGQLDAGQTGHWMFAEPGNIVLEQGPHPFSQVHALVGRLLGGRAEVLATRILDAGQPFHTRWVLAARAERGGAEVHLGFGTSFARSSLVVLGSDGCLEADLVHDVVVGERKTPWLEFWNTFLASRGRARSYARDARRGLVGYLCATLGLGPRADAWFVGMRESIAAFHDAHRAGEPAPADGREAAEVLEWCEACVAHLPPTQAREPLAPSGTPPRPGEVCVLGGAGFIGRRAVLRLLARGLPVTLAARRTAGLPRELEDAARTGRLRLVRASLEDPASLAAAVAGCAAVVHLATGGGETWDEVERSMLGGTRALAEACLAAGSPRLVYVSSIAALDTRARRGDAPLVDSPAVDPRADERAVYSRGKALTERMLQELAARRGLRLVVLRPGVVIGAGTALQHSGYGLWARDNHCVGWGRGETPLPLVAADDVAEAIALAVTHAGPGLEGQALNLAARTTLSARRMVEELARATGRDLVFHPRRLWISQLAEIGKWLVKRAGGRRDVPFPSWHDLAARSLARPLASNLARELLGWKPVEDEPGLLALGVRVYAPVAPDAGGPSGGEARR